MNSIQWKTNVDHRDLIPKWASNFGRSSSRFSIDIRAEEKHYLHRAFDSFIHSSRPNVHNFLLIFDMTFCISLPLSWTFRMRSCRHVSSCSGKWVFISKKNHWQESWRENGDEQKRQMGKVSVEIMKAMFTILPDFIKDRVSTISVGHWKKAFMKLTECVRQWFLPGYIRTDLFWLSSTIIESLTINNRWIT